MKDETKKNIPSMEPYKGVRDFYPQDQFVQRYIFETMARVCELYGYEEYGASVLEPAELYRAKTSEEIVNDETYKFRDRGDREVTLRPELTPTFARMVAAKRRDIPLPARWYAIANAFRYQRPQKGRLREFWQLNADIVGIDGIEADAEIIALAHNVVRSFGAEERNFEIRVSDRRLLESAYDECGIAPEVRAAVTRLLDKRGKIDTFEEELARAAGEKTARMLVEHLDRTTSSAYLEELRGVLQSLGVRNMVVDTKITRGFDYYTGMVFEIFDTDESNRRSLAGGGRYDSLLSLFGGAPIPAVGFAMGDVITRDFLEAHNLIPNYTPSTELMLGVIDKTAVAHAMRLAQDLRREDVAVAVNFSLRRAGDQIKTADELGIPFIIMVGEQERDSGKYTIRQLENGNEVTLPADRISEHLFSALG